MDLPTYHVNAAACVVLVLPNARGRDSWVRHYLGVPLVVRLPVGALPPAAAAAIAEIGTLAFRTALACGRAGQPGTDARFSARQLPVGVG